MVIQRTEYYKFAFSAIFETIYGTPVPGSGVRFEYESAFMAGKEYILEFFKLVALTSQQDSRVVCEETQMLGPLLCAPLQALDHQFYDIDIEYGGLDQVSMLSVLAYIYLPPIRLGCLII